MNIGRETERQQFIELLCRTLSEETEKITGEPFVCFCGENKIAFANPADGRRDLQRLVHIIRK